MAFPKNKKDIQMALLKVLIEAGGSTTSRDAVVRIYSYFPELTPADLDVFQPSGRIRKWVNIVQWVRQDLVTKGAIDRSVRGVWAITDLGRAMITTAEKGPSPSVRSKRKLSS